MARPKGSWLHAAFIDAAISSSSKMFEYKCEHGFSSFYCCSPFALFFTAPSLTFIDPSALEKPLHSIQIKDANNDKPMLNPLELTYAANANEFSPSRSRIANYPPPIVPTGASPSAQRRRGLNSPSVFRRSALRDSNWRQRGVSFVLPSADADPFYSEGGKLGRYSSGS